MKEAKKTFDAVATMRGIRDRLSGRIQAMTFEEQRAYIRKQLKQKARRRRESKPVRQPR